MQQTKKNKLQHKKVYCNIEGNILKHFIKTYYNISSTTNAILKKRMLQQKIYCNIGGESAATMRKNYYNISITTTATSKKNTCCKKKNLLQHRRRI